MIGGATGTWLVLQVPLLWPLLVVTVPMFLFSALLWLGWRWPAWGLIVLFSLLLLLLVVGMLLVGVTFQSAFKLIATVLSIWELYQYWRRPQLEPELPLALQPSPWEHDQIEQEELLLGDWDHYELSEEEEYEYEGEPYEEEDSWSRADSWEETSWDQPHPPWQSQQRIDDPNWGRRGWRDEGLRG